MALQVPHHTFTFGNFALVVFKDGTMLCNCQYREKDGQCRHMRLIETIYNVLSEVRPSCHPEKDAPPRSGITRLVEDEFTVTVNEEEEDVARSAG